MNRLRRLLRRVGPSLVHVLWATVFMVALETAVGELDRGVAWLGFIYGILPISLAISLPYIPVDQNFRAQALRLAGIVTILMVALDVGGPTAFVQVGTTARTVGGEAAREVPVVAEYSIVSGIRTLVLDGRNGFPGVDEHLSRYPANHPRVRVTYALFKLSALAMPFVLALFIAWSAQWIRREIPDQRSALRAQFFASWILGPGLYWLVFNWTEQAKNEALVGGGSLVYMGLPSLLVIAAAWMLPRRVQSPSEAVLERSGS